MSAVRFVSIIGGLILVAVIGAACGGATPTPTVTPAPTATPEPTATREPTATAPVTPTATEVLDPAALGESLAARNGCLACHSVDGSASTGPTWQGLWGTEETMTDGSTVEVDEDYLRESIVAPNAKIVKGFPADVMPQDYGEKLAHADIQAMIEYIKTLQ